MARAAVVVPVAVIPAVAATRIAARTTVVAPHAVETMAVQAAIRVDVTATAEAIATTSFPTLVFAMQKTRPRGGSSSCAKDARSERRAKT